MRWIGRLPTKYSPERKFESEIDSAECHSLACPANVSLISSLARPSPPACAPCIHPTTDNLVRA